jgi:hypothetical protein
LNAFLARFGGALVVGALSIGWKFAGCSAWLTYIAAGIALTLVLQETTK